MTTTIGQRGQVVIPKEIRARRQIEPGDDFEVALDDEDADLIILRRIRPSANAGLLEHLTVCPYKGPLPSPVRRRESMRGPKL